MMFVAALMLVTLATLLMRPRASRFVLAWALAWIACCVWLTAPMSAQSGAPNGKQFNLSITNGAVVQLTVPAGTTYCTISIGVNAINWDVGNPTPAPTTTTGIPATAGAILNFGSFILCKNWGGIATGSNATINAVFYR